MAGLYRVCPTVNTLLFIYRSQERGSFVPCLNGEAAASFITCRTDSQALLSAISISPKDFNGVAANMLDCQCIQTGDTGPRLNQSSRAHGHVHTVYFAVRKIHCGPAAEIGGFCCGFSLCILWIYWRFRTQISPIQWD